MKRRWTGDVSVTAAIIVQLDIPTTPVYLPIV